MNRVDEIRDWLGKIIDGHVEYYNDGKSVVVHEPAEGMIRVDATDIAYLLGEVERLREVLTEIVESVDDDKHPMNSYAAGYAGGLRENVERAQKALKGVE